MRESACSLAKIVFRNSALGVTLRRDFVQHGEGGA